MPRVWWYYLHGSRARKHYTTRPLPPTTPKNVCVPGFSPREYASIICPLLAIVKYIVIEVQGMCPMVECCQGINRKIKYCVSAIKIIVLKSLGIQNNTNAKTLCVSVIYMQSGIWDIYSGIYSATEPITAFLYSSSHNYYLQICS